MAVRGGTPDRKPIAVRSVSPGHEADAIVVPALETEDALRTHPEQAVLGEVKSPFGLALERGIALGDRLRDEPEEGERTLLRLVEAVRAQIELVLDAGADGVFYCLDGAYPPASTPMEYGGHYLETDRALLDSIAQARLNILYVVGGPETYFDCLADLPAHAFAWDIEASGIGMEQMRAIRPGALAAADPSADILLVDRFDDAKQILS